MGIGQGATGVWRATAGGLIGLLLVVGARADTLDLSTGDHLVGRIVSVCSSNVTITNAYAGTLRIDRPLVTRLTIVAPMRLALTNGDRLLGRITVEPDGRLSVTASNDVQHVVSTGAVVAVWQPDAVDPTLPPRRFSWKQSVWLDVHGQSGNTRSFYGGGGIESVVSTTNMDLKLYGHGSDATSEGVLSERKLVGGADFEQRFARVRSLYLREEAERDEITGIRFRNAMFYGYGHYLFREPDRLLRLRLGLGHTVVEYTDPTKRKDSNITADSSIKYSEKLGKHATWSSEVIYQPVLKDRANYFLTHESKLSLPLAVPNLTEELGISNEYVSQPGADTKPLDTTYFIRTKYTW